MPHEVYRGRYKKKYKRKTKALEMKDDYKLPSPRLAPKAGNLLTSRELDVAEESERIMDRLELRKSLFGSLRRAARRASSGGGSSRKSKARSASSSFSKPPAASGIKAPPPRKKVQSLGSKPPSRADMPKIAASRRAAGARSAQRAENLANKLTQDAASVRRARSSGPKPPTVTSQRVQARKDQAARNRARMKAMGRKSSFNRGDYATMNRLVSNSPRRRMGIFD